MKNYKFLFFICLLAPGTCFCAGGLDGLLSYPVGCMQIVDASQKISQENLRSCLENLVDGINESRIKTRQQIAEKNGELSQLRSDYSEQNRYKNSKIEQLEKRISALETALENLKKELRPAKQSPGKTK